MVLISWIEEVYWSTVIIYALTLFISVCSFNSYRDGFLVNGKYVDKLHQVLYYFLTVSYCIMLVSLAYLLYAIHHLFGLEGIL